MEFNPKVHVTDDIHGDPVRNAEGEYRLKTNWKELATDGMGRSYNPKIHGEKAELSDRGELKVVRRDGRTPMTATNRSQALVEKHRKPGYAYYLADSGRQGQFEAHDYEVVSDENGPATLPSGRTADSKLVLMSKPEEWYAEDQEAKEALNSKNLKTQSSPDEEKGQYGEGLKTSLR